MRCALFLCCREICATCGYVAVATRTPTKNSTSLHFTSLSPHSASIDLAFGIWHSRFAISENQKTATRRQNTLVPFGPKKQHPLIGFLILSYLRSSCLTLPYHILPYLITSNNISVSLSFSATSTRWYLIWGNNAPTVALLCWKYMQVWLMGTYVRATFSVGSMWEKITWDKPKKERAMQNLSTFFHCWNLLHPVEFSKTEVTGSSSFSSSF